MGRPHPPPKHLNNRKRFGKQIVKHEELSRLKFVIRQV